MPDQTGKIAVRDNPGSSRYEALVDDQLAGYAVYNRVGDRIVLTHTEILDAYQGRGVGGALAEAVLYDIRAKGKQITPLCPFVASYIRRHPGYVDLVDPDHRGDFDTDPG